MTIRIEPALLSALKERARLDGRSVSGEVIRLIGNELRPKAVARRTKQTRTMGKFSGFEAPGLEELTDLRRQFSRVLEGRPARGRRR